ncbi:MAG: hypothetical protein K2K75_07865 [Muribaculaceae bacterium]|nr:hypothetical protein [Muribaculaceae bacterium]
MHGDSHSCDGPSGRSLQHVDPDAYVDALMHGELKPVGFKVSETAPQYRRFAQYRRLASQYGECVVL